jgi:hypothetical protein
MMNQAGHLLLPGSAVDLQENVKTAAAVAVACITAYLCYRLVTAIALLHRSTD